MCKQELTLNRGLLASYALKFSLFNVYFVFDIKDEANVYVYSLIHFPRVSLSLIRMIIDATKLENMKND